MNRRLVVSVDKLGSRETIVDGLRLTPFGMTVDQERGHLWIATSSIPIGAGEPQAEVVQLNLKTLKRTTFRDPRARSANDLVVAPNGDVLVTDFAGAAVWKIDARTRTWTEVLKRGDVNFPNGITRNEDGSRFYLSQGLSILSLDAASGITTRLKFPENLSTFGIDGLYYHKGALFAVQNVATPGRILRLDLDADGTSVVSVTLLDSAHPLFDLPTTGAIADGKFLLIANAQTYLLEREQAATRPSNPVTILSYNLKGN